MNRLNFLSFLMPKRPSRHATGQAGAKHTDAKQHRAAQTLAQAAKDQRNEQDTNDETAVALLNGTVLRAFSGLYEVDVRAPLDASTAVALPKATPSEAVPPETKKPARKKAAKTEEFEAAAMQDAVAEEAEAKIEAEQSSDILLCQVSGRLKKGKRLMAQPVSVGDRVRVRSLETSGMDARGRTLREGYIEEVRPRTSVLARSRFNKANQITVANLDQAVIVMSLREPELNTHRLDRFLVLAESSELRAVICLNKADLVPKRSLPKATRDIIALYGGLGYQIVTTSAEKDLGVEALRELLRDHISAVLGSSGVGKSSLINAVQPGLHLWVGDVMEIGKGRHTTTDVSLHRLDKGGYIADTPGIKTVSLLEREDVDLAQCFPEFVRLETPCRFNNCKHLHEPGCAVRAAVEAKQINAARYESYRRMSLETQSEDQAKAEPQTASSE